MMHSTPRVGAATYPIVSSPRRLSALPPAYPRTQRLTANPQRAAILTRRYETNWLTPEGFVESATRIAPALPQFEEAFSAIARGSLIETTEGLAAVEDIVPGMKVVTAEGRIETVTWIGSMTLFPAETVRGLSPASMTRITADAFGPARPMPDLMLGPQARILMRGARARGLGAAYISARTLIDGESVIEVAPVAPVAVFHLVLERQGSLRCAGIEVESYHPGRDHAQRFDAQLLGLFLAMFPQIRTMSDFGVPAHARLQDDEDGAYAA